MPRSKKEGWINWSSSAARRIILEDLAGGYIALTEDEMEARKIWDLYYSKLGDFIEEGVVWEQFHARFKDHRKQVQGAVRRSHIEKTALEHDRKIFPRNKRNAQGELVFDLHPAKLLLREDIENKKHVGKTSHQLWETRDEYQDFKEPIFRQRIYQEIRRVKMINYLNEQREKKKSQLDL